MRQDGEDRRAGSPGIRHATSIVGQSFALNATGSNFGSMFVNLKPYGERRTPEPVGRAPSADRLTVAVRQAFPTPSSRCSRRRRCAASGGPAASPSSSRTAATWGPCRFRTRTDNLIRQGLPGAGADAACSPPTGPTCRSCTSSPTPAMRVARRQAWPTSTTPWSSSRARCTSTTSTASAGPGRSSSSPTPASATSVGPAVPPQGPQRHGGHGAARLAGGHVQEQNGPLVLTRYNMYPAATDQRQRRCRRVVRPGHRHHGRPGRTRAAAVAGLRMDRHVLPGIAGRRHRHEPLRLRRGRRFPGAGRPVRKLVAAAGRHPGRPAVPARAPLPACRLRTTDINIFTQIGFVVLVGLASKNAILIVEFAKHKREEGLARRDGGAGGVPAAAAADRHDLDGLHPGRGAAADVGTGPASRCGGRWARRCSPA